jgi:hypothetical protein
MPEDDNGGSQQGQQQQSQQQAANNRGFASQATETHPDSLTKDAKGDWVRRQK